jgi:hypothetical protein
MPSTKVMPSDAYSTQRVWLKRGLCNLGSPVSARNAAESMPWTLGVANPASAIGKDGLRG